LRKVADAPPRWLASHSQWRGSRVTSLPRRPSAGRTADARRGIWLGPQIDVDLPPGLVIEREQVAGALKRLKRAHPGDNVFARAARQKLALVKNGQRHADYLPAEADIYTRIKIINISG
jgi:hypothetical protein